MAQLQHIRCPCCGKVNRRKKYDMVHRVELLTLTIGGRGRCSWEREDKSFDPEHLGMLIEFLERCLARLKADLKALAGDD